MAIYQSGEAHWLARIVRYASVTPMITAAAMAEQKLSGPRPMVFTPAPSSLLLVLAGLAVVLGWNWWRSRSGAVRD